MPGSNFNFDQTDVTGANGILITTPPLLPGASITADLGNGPGIQEVATFSQDVAGPGGGVAVSNAHGTVTGAAGGVLLRPFARLISTDNGDSVTYLRRTLEYELTRRIGKGSAPAHCARGPILM